MDTAGFLARIVPASGNYLSIVYKLKGGGWGTRSFKLSEVREAVRLSEWHAKNGNDAYFALAAFNAADVTVDAKGRQRVIAPREQKNVQYLRCFAMDADVKRAGDKKDPATCFPDKRAAVTWLWKFCEATSFPFPNAAVDSGYGLHFYWVLEEELRLAEWQPLADALKAAMLANNWVGDTSITIDSARILRVPGTQNFKSGTGVPVRYLAKFEDQNYPKATIEAALQPYVGMVQAKTGTGGTANLGQRPKHLPSGGGLHENAAGWANTERQYSMGAIAQRCLQVKASLANNGAGDPYPLWYRDNLSLCAFTIDGVDYVHELSKGDPRYTEAATDAAWARIQQERDTKGLGAPTCASFDADRRGVCPGCPWYKKITSPIVLGADDGDLPFNYRRNKTDGTIERLIKTKDGPDWVLLIKGDVYAPRLEKLATGGHRITFTYALAGEEHPVALNGADLNNQMPLSLLENQHLAVNRHTAPLFADFAMAWIEKLREQRTEHDLAVKPFGWQHNHKGELIGGSVAGEFYRTDGNTDMVPGGDRGVIAQYQPMGDFANWRKAAALFEGKRPDLQTLIATSFAGPLIGLAGAERGMSLNFWSAPSGVGKTSALRVGHSVWGDPVKGVQTLKDTVNAMMRSLSEPRFLTRFWDEMRVNDKEVDRFVDIIYTIPEGKERSRLRSDIVLRETGEWETILVMTSNRAYADHLVRDGGGTDSGVLRLLEIALSKDDAPLDPVASQTLKLLETNYGHAGREYLRYLVQNIDAVRAKLAAIKSQLGLTLAASQEERFYITAAATIIVGASIAKNLKLFDFDVKAISQVLCDAINNARMVRDHHTLVLANGVLDVEQLVSDFLQEFGDCVLRTETLGIGGRGNSVVIIAPPKTGRVKAQIVQTPAILRVGQNDFYNWLRRRRNLSTKPVIDELINTYQAKQHKAGIGAGTTYSGTVRLIEIPLTGPFASILDDGSSAPSARRGRAFGSLAGNQPTA